MSELRSFRWQMPVAVQFGAGCVRDLFRHLGDRTAIVMALDTATRLGWREQWTGELGSRLQSWSEVPDGLSSISRCEEFSQQVWPALAANPDAVLIALGGGTTLDIAKVLRCRPVQKDPRSDQIDDRCRPTLTNGFERIAAALRGTAPWPALHLAPLWMVPTTAGTGSEVTRWATVWDTEEAPGQKRSFDEPFGFAERAFVDPLLTHSCPAAVTRDTGLDALSHALEAIWNRHANPCSDVLALSAARTILAWLPVAMREPGHAQAREALSLAALEAGMAFSQTRTALAHALSYAVTLEQGVPHGLACAMWLPTAWSLAQGHDTRVDRLLEAIFDPSTVPSFASVDAERGASALRSWLRGVGVSCDPLTYGIGDAPQRITSALHSPRGRNFIAAPP